MAVEISEIGAKLNVANVLEGSVRRAANRVRVTVQLVDVRNASICGRSATIVRCGTSSKYRIRSTEDPQAYVLKGRHHWRQRSPAPVRLAIPCFEQPIKLDSRYALAYGGLADCYVILGAYAWVSPKEAGPPAYAAVTKAMTLKPALSGG